MGKSKSNIFLLFLFFLLSISLIIVSLVPYKTKISNIKGLQTNNNTGLKYWININDLDKSKISLLPKASAKEKVSDWQLIRVNSEEELKTLRKELGIKRIYPDHKRFISTPDDSYYNSQNTIISGQYDQWNLRFSGFTPLSDPTSGWNITTGSSETIVAVIDTGISLTNPDIVNGNGSTWGDNNLWINQEEIPAGIFGAIDTNTNGNVESSELINYFVSNNLDINSNGTINYLDIIASGSPIRNGVDNNTPPNGYVDDIFGYNFADTNPDVSDINGHGTHVSGIIGATTNNNAIINPGISGVCWTCKIMPLKVINSQGFGYDSDIVAAIDYAVENGAKVINMSLGGPGYSEPMQVAITDAWNNGVLVVSASGNYASSASDSYPGGSAFSLSVGSLTYLDQKAYYSNTGPKLDIMAYGDNVLSTFLPTSYGCVGAGNYACLSGTSMASPHVAGLAALIFDLHKDDVTPWTAREVRNALIKNAVDMNTVGFDDATGFGRIYAKTALEATAISVDSTNPTATITGLANSIQKGTFNISGTAYDDNLYIYTVSFQRQSDNYIVKQYSGRSSITGSTLLSIDSTQIPDDIYDVILRVEDFYGNVSTTTATNITIDNTAPSTFSLTTPANNSATTQTRPTFTWTTSSDANTVTYDIVLNGVTQGSDLVTTEYTPGSDLAEGTYSWNVTAKDTVLNTRTTSNFTFYADRTPPNPFIVSVSPNGSSPSISFTATDSISGVQSYQASINGGAFVSVNSPYNPGILPDGNYTVVIRAIDKAGNSRDSSTSFSISNVCNTRKTKGDFNCDGIVNLSDLSILAANWMKANSTADATGDNMTNLSDLSILAANWLKNV